LLSQRKLKHLLPAQTHLLLRIQLLLHLHRLQQILLLLKRLNLLLRLLRRSNALVVALESQKAAAKKQEKLPNLAARQKQVAVKQNHPLVAMHQRLQVALTTASKKTVAKRKLKRKAALNLQPDSTHKKDRHCGLFFLRYTTPILCENPLVRNHLEKTA
jgi:hypothetical protein